MRTYPILIFTLATLVLACNNQQPPIIGSWDSQKVQVTLNHGQPDEEVLVANKAEFPEKMNMKAAMGYYYKDGTYRDAYISMEDTISFATNGVWEINGDSLTVYQQEPAKDTFRHQFTINGDRGEFKTMIDFDGDGQEDDLMTSVSKKISDTPPVEGE